MYVFINCKYCSFETILFHLIDNGWKQKMMIPVQTMVYFKANKINIHTVVLIKISKDSLPLNDIFLFALIFYSQPFFPSNTWGTGLVGPMFIAKRHICSFLG